MGRLSVFNFVSMDGYFEGPNRDISWHKHDAEQNEYAVQMLKSENVLLFGRVTYDLMASYRPMPIGIKSNPVIAEGMNSAEKIVFSRTLKEAKWNNTRLVKDDICGVIRKAKETSGKNMTILGSGSIMTQFAQEGLIDEYQFMVDPVVLGGGTPIFKGIKGMLNLKLASTRTFRNGSVLLCYQT
jgi:dihydrofolate reductase